MEMGDKPFTMLSKAGKKEIELPLACYCQPEEAYALGLWEPMSRIFEQVHRK
jgi:hypothetical protein